MRNKLGGPSTQPQTHWRPLSHTPSLLPDLPRTPAGAASPLPVAAATTHGLSEPLQDLSGSPGQLSLPAKRAATARSPPLSTGPDWAPLPVRLGRVSHLNDTVLGRADLVLQPEQPRETKAVATRARRRNRGFLRSPVAALSFFLGLLSFASPAFNFVWCCSHYAHAPRLKMFCFRKKPCLYITCRPLSSNLSNASSEHHRWASVSDLPLLSLPENSSHN